MGLYCRPTQNEDYQVLARTLRTGMSLLDEARDEVVAARSTVFPGDVAFKLHDTHGFPNRRRRQSVRRAHVRDHRLQRATSGHSGSD